MFQLQLSALFEAQCADPRQYGRDVGEETLHEVQPCLHLGCLVGGEIVEHQMDISTRGHGLGDLA
jgi:hypothetical protein